jgi:hypothetical protein
MKIPTKIKYGAYEITVNITTDELSTDTGNGGTFKVKDGYKCITLKQTDELTQSECFMHELIEAIVWRNQLDLPHQSITIISENIFEIIRRNNLDFGGSHEKGK